MWEERVQITAGFLEERGVLRRDESHMKQNGFQYRNFISQIIPNLKSFKLQIPDTFIFVLISYCQRDWDGLFPVSTHWNFLACFFIFHSISYCPIKTSACTRGHAESCHGSMTSKNSFASAVMFENSRGEWKTIYCGKSENQKNT